MLCALQWLLANNIYYRNVRIDPDALALLPEDKDLTGLCSMTLETSDDNQELPSLQDVNPNDAHLARRFVPITAQRLTDQVTIQQSINERRSHQPPPTVHGLLAVEHPSMSSTQRATSLVLQYVRRGHVMS